MEYVTLRKYISHPSLVIYSFAILTIKLKLGQEIGGGLLIAKHLDQSLRWANQTHWAAVRSYLVQGNIGNYAGPKPFSWAKPAYVRFSSSNFTVKDHVGSTIGDALSKKEVLPSLQYVGDRYLLACSRYKGTGWFVGWLVGFCVPCLWFGDRDSLGNNFPKMSDLFGDPSLVGSLESLVPRLGIQSGHR